MTANLWQRRLTDHMNYELIGVIANISLALSLIVALIFGIMEARSSDRERREALTLETLRTFETREFAELLQYVETHAMPKSRAELRALPPNEQVMFIQFSQQMENLGILVAERMIDIDLVDKTLGSFVSTTWRKIKPMAEQTRAEDREPFFSEYFQWLAELIDERLKTFPRQAFHEAHPRRSARLKR